MLACENLKEFFKNTDLEKEKEKQIAYFTTETGGPKIYEGKNMKDAHKGTHVKSESFELSMKFL